MVARLELLDQYLGEFDPLPSARQESVVLWQKKRTQPWSLEQRVAGGADAKTIFTLNWLINDEKLDGQEELALDVMDDLLMGTPVAPLYKALRESGLGESVISDGLETVLQQACGLACSQKIRPELFNMYAGDIFGWSQMSV